MPAKRSGGVALLSLLLAAVPAAAQGPGDAYPDLLIGAGPDGGLTRLMSGVDGSELAAGYPFGPGFRGGIHVAAGDITGDGVADLVAATAGGGGDVVAFDGATLVPIARVQPFGAAFRGGVHVATGDIDGDGHADLIVGGGTGSGLVRIFSGATQLELARGYPFGASYAGGVTVATGDVDGDGQVDLIAATAIGGTLRVFRGASTTLLASGFPYGPAFVGGIQVAAGDIDGDGRAEVITATRSGTGVVHVLDAVAGSIVISLRPFPGLGSVSVAAGDLDNDGLADLVVGAGPGGAPRVRAYRASDRTVLFDALALAATFTGGVFVATTADPSGVRFTSPSEVTFEAGEAGSFTITTSGRVAPITQSGALPGGVTFTDNGDGTATLAGTADAGTGGTYPLTFQGGLTGTVTQDFTLVVSERPSVTSAGSTTFLAGEASTFTVTSAGFPEPALSLTGSLPDGVTFTDNGDGTGLLGGTPAAGGTYALTITASNGVGPDASAPFTLAVNQRPTFTSAAATTFTVGSAGSFVVTTSGVPPVTAIVRGGASLPGGVTYTDHGDGTATLAGTPAPGTGGTYAFTFTVDNGVGAPVMQNFVLTVGEAPAITSAAATTFGIGGPGTFTVTTTGFPAPTLTRTGAALPTGVTFVDNGNGTGTLSGTPAAGTGGSYAFTLTAANGVGADATQGFTLTVNQAPVFTSAAATTFAVGTPGTFTVTTAGVPPATTISPAGALPAGVTFTDNGDSSGTLAGTPSPGTGGTYVITLTASNGVHDPVAQTFTLTVTEAPAITSAAAATFVAGQAGSFTVTTTGFPAPALTPTGDTLPEGLTFTDNGNGTGTLAGTAGAAAGGTYALAFTAANGVGVDDVQAFTLTVNEAPAFTSAAGATFVVGAAGSFTVATTGFPAISTIARTGDALPGGVTYTDLGNGTATLAGTPVAGTGGAYALTFTINNGVGGDVAQSFTLSVNEPPQITSAASSTFTVGQPGSFEVTRAGFPAAGVTLTSGTLPAGVTFTPGTRMLSGTPAAGTQAGSPYTLQFTADNGVSPAAVQSFTLNVACPVITVSPAGPALADGTFGQDYPVTFTASGGTGPYAFAVTAGALPAGTTLATTGALSGTLTNTGVFSFTVTATDDVSCTGSTAYSVTVRPDAQNDSYTGGVGNTELLVGVAAGLTPAVALTGTVLDNDSGPALTITTSSPLTTTNGGQVFLNANGSFTYRPPVGNSTSDSFSYTVSSNGVTDTGTVTLGLSGLVWYVNSGAAGGGDGRSHAPFTTLDAAATPSGSGSVIYVHTGSGSTTGSLALDGAQSLHGQGATFTLNGLTIPAGTRPTLAGTVTLADNAVVRAVNFQAAAPALQASSATFTLPVTIDQVAVTGGTSAISLSNVSATGTGAVTVTNATFINTTLAEVTINGGNVPVTLASTVSISSNAGRSVDVSNRTGGSVTFNGPITDTGQGIRLSTNTGSTVTFAGGLSLSTGPNDAFTATGGGTVVATQNNTSIVNTLATTTGTTLTVTDTTIGAAGLTFRSISANGAASGIVLDATGASGGLTVTGTGSTALGGDGSGGTIQNTTGHGVSLTSTLNPSFTNLTIANTGGSGINGMLVTNFTFAHGTISGSGNAVNESNIAFNGNGTLLGNNLSGTLSVTNSNLTTAFYSGIDLSNDAGTISLATITGNTITSSTSTATSLGYGISLVGLGNASTAATLTRATISNNTVRNFPSGGGIQVLYGNANASGPGGTAGIPGDPTNVIAITNNVSRGASAVNRFGTHAIIFTISGGNPSSRSRGNFNVSNNGTVAQPIGDSTGIALGIGNNGYATMTATISDNVIVANNTLGSGGISGGNGVVSGGGAETPDLTVTVSNNQISQVDGNGIILVGRGTAGIVRATIQNNAVAAPLTGLRPGIRVDAGNASSTNDSVCVHISNNTTAGSGGVAGIGLRKQGTASAVNAFGVVGMSATATPGVEQFIGNTGLNPGSANGVGDGSVNGVLLISATSGFSSCTIP